MSPKLSENGKLIQPSRVWWVGAVLALLATPALSGAKPLVTVSDLTITERGDVTVIQVRASARPVFSVFKLEHPPRLTVDLAGGQLARVDSLRDVQSWAVTQVDHSAGASRSG
jgi:hypothetical protein